MTTKIATMTWRSAVIGGLAAAGLALSASADEHGWAVEDTTQAEAPAPGDPDCPWLTQVKYPFLTCSEDADGNVVWAISVSATVTALAVSGVAWVQPPYVVISLTFGTAIFGLGLLADARALRGDGRSLRGLP